MSLKENENQKARQLYKFPKIGTKEVICDPYGFITKSPAKLTRNPKIENRWEEILRSDCEICFEQVKLKHIQKNIFDPKHSEKSKFNSEKPKFKKESKKNESLMEKIRNSLISSSNTSIENQIKFNSLFYTPDQQHSITSLIFRGVPVPLKARVWKHLLISKKKWQNISLAEYLSLKNMKSGFEYQIHVDIQRTFRNHKDFHEAFTEGQCFLFRVLVAYSNYNKNIGYCQGMASFAGLILMYFNEHDSFILLVSILADLESLFDCNLSLLPSLMNVQKQIFISVIPEIFYILKNENVDLCLFVYSWYLTLFSRFDIKLTLRIWDIFIFYGPTVLLAVTTGVLSHYSEEISKLQGEELIKFLNSLDTLPLKHTQVEDIVRRIRNVIDECDLEDISHTLGI